MIARGHYEFYQVFIYVLRQTVIIKQDDYVFHLSFFVRVLLQIMDQTDRSYHGGTDRMEFPDNVHHGPNRKHTFYLLHPSPVHGNRSLRHFVCSPP